MRYALVNQLGMVLVRHDDATNAQQEALFFHAATGLPYSIVEEKS